jgi:Formiminotransferase domain
LHPTAGITAVGARKVLIAYNIYLNTSNVSVAREIARVIRFSNGGMRHVKAIGVEMKTRNLAQVSINLTDYEQTPLHHVFDAVKEQAQRRGCSVVGSEIIGLIPRKALELSAGHDLQLENFSPERILENRLAAVAGILPLPEDFLASPANALQPLAESLREAVQSFSQRALTLSSHAARAGAQSTADHDAADEAESYLEMARAAAEISERLGQLEAVSVPPTLLDWQTIKQAAMAAARSALKSAEAIYPSLQDAGMVRKFKSDSAEIEAKLTGKPVPTEK